MATSQPSELALRELLAVSIGTVSCYATLDPFMLDARALCEVLAETGHSDLAAQLTQAALAVGKALQAVANLAVPQPQQPSQADVLDGLTSQLRQRGQPARYPQPGTHQARPDPSWSGQPTPPGGFTSTPSPWPAHLTSMGSDGQPADQDGD